MNKTEYLSALSDALKSVEMQDRADILEEYAEHFNMKIADGYSEDEIAARLAAPEEIAEQFIEIVSDNDETNIKTGLPAKIVKTTAVAFLDIAVTPMYLALWAWVLTFAVASISFMLVGVFTAFGIQSFTSDGIILIPYMPLVCRLLLSVAIVSLALLSAIGTEYCRLYVLQIGRKFMHWHNKVLGKKGHVSPALPLNPQLSSKKRRIMRNMSLVTTLVFAVFFITGLVSMMIAAGSIEPWHVWGWLR